MSDEITLVVNNIKFAYWKSANIRNGIEQIAGEFALTFADRWSKERESVPFSEGDECEVLVGDTLVIAGYIDDLETSISATETTDSLRGRDYTGDLVDCSAENSPDEFKDINLADLATKLCQPFGIKVIQDADIGEKFPIFKLQHGETVFEALDRAARMRGVLLTSAKDKGVFLTTPGVAKFTTPLVQGKNILTARKLSSYANRYSQYTVKGQQGGITLDKFKGDEKSTSGVALDTVIKRFRPLTILAENQANTDVAKKRAEWESTNRAARSLSLSVTVQGWINSQGKLWLPNYLVDLEIPRLQIKAEMLITSCNYSISESAGSTTILELRDKKSYTLQPEIKKDYKAESEEKLKL